MRRSLRMAVARGSDFLGTIRKLVMVLTLSQPALLCAGTEQAPISIAGIWRLEVSSMVADATGYFVLAQDNSCHQVVKIKLLGMTKWTVRHCDWSYDGRSLTLILRKSAEKKEKSGTFLRVAVEELTQEKLVISSDGEKQIWYRDNDLPAAFREHLQDV